MTPGYRLDELPYLLEEIEPFEAVLEQRAADFRVEEIPLYEINNEGPHLYFEVRKRNLSTDRAVSILEEQLNVDDNFEIGFAGRKDKNAVTTQRMSLEHAEPEDLDAVTHVKLDVTPLGYHRNKLQPGHLKGNEFTVKLRVSSATPNIDTIRDRQQQLIEKGVPNYFGPQRFGLRQDTSKLGEYMVKDNLSEFIQQYFGRPSEQEPSECREARVLFEQDQYEAAMDAWPKQYSNKRRGLAAWIDTGKAEPVLSAISKQRRQLFVSAYQSQLFNELLADRIPQIDRVKRGDIAKKMDTGGMFEVKQPEAEQPRADTFDISPTGLLPGRDPWYASHQPGEREQDLLDRHDLSEEDFDTVSYLRSSGERRTFRFNLEAEPPESGTDQHGPFVKLIFRLPSGCYATVFLREVLRKVP
ncbi:MAG: tRNA pseudouridine(13) synthase TruD [bacterium]